MAAYSVIDIIISGFWWESPLFMLQIVYNVWRCRGYPFDSTLLKSPLGVIYIYIYVHMYTNEHIWIYYHMYIYVYQIYIYIYHQRVLVWSANGWLLHSHQTTRSRNTWLSWPAKMPRWRGKGEVRILKTFLNARDTKMWRPYGNSDFEDWLCFPWDFTALFRFFSLRNTILSCWCLESTRSCCLQALQNADFESSASAVFAAKGKVGKCLGCGIPGPRDFQASLIAWEFMVRISMYGPSLLTYYPPISKHLYTLLEYFVGYMHDSCV